jgi:c-di-GMP-binding flagellar brake protein YcgR
MVLNRRSSARLETPLGVYYMASFVMNGKPYELQLYDFSAGGVGMRAAPRDAVGLHVGKKLQRVRLELGPDSVMIADLEVRLSRTFRSFLLGEQVQIGCQFSNLSPAMEEELKRLLDKLHSGKQRTASLWL